MKTISLSNSDLLIEINDEDWLEFALQTWHLSGYGYAMRPYKLGTIYFHIEVARKMNLKGKIDHKDRNKLNNQRENLRESTQTTNGQNANKTKSSTSSIYKGVTFESRRNKWEAKIQVNGVKIWLGYFDEQEEAAKAYDNAAKKHFGEFACLNSHESS